MVQLIYTEPLHSCEYCGLEYWKTPAYIKHLIELHNADLPKCSFCYKQFLSNKHLHEHLENMHTADGGNKRQKCSTCSCSFKRLRDLKTHLARKHGPIAKPVLQCKYCRCEFYQRSTYTNHMLDKHWNKTVFQCNECLYKFKYKRLLERHIQIKHGTINHWAKCTFCPASYKWAHDLKKHYQERHLTLWLKRMKVKTTEDKGQNFKCSFDACMQSFESKEKCMEHHLNEHKVNLANKQDFQCGNILKPNLIPNQNVGNLSYGLIMVPERFPQEIVDFECELQKVNEFRKLIDKRILDSRTDQEINPDSDDTASSITDAETELTSGLQDVLQVKSSIASVITDSVEKHNVNNNLVTEEEKQYFRTNNFVTLDESLTNIQKDKGNIVLKDLKIIVTRIEDDKTLNDENQKVQSTNNTSKLNIHDLNALRLIRNNLLIDINVEKKIATFYSCRLCKLKFRVKKSLEHHMSEEHNDGCVLASHKCKFCDAVFPFKHYLRQHIRGEHRLVLQRFRPSKLIKTCAKCELTFESAQLYNKHMKIEHLQSNRTSKSSSCNITVNTRGILKNHRRLKHNQKQRLNSSVNEEPGLDNAADSYKCIACGVVCKDKLCLEEHMQLVHRSEENRQNVENDLVEINKKVEEMKLERKKISRAVKNIKMSRGIKKRVTRKKFTMKIRPFGRSLKDLNSRFILKNGVITSSKLEEDSLASNKQNVVSDTNSSLCSQKRKLQHTNMQESALNGLDLINTPKQSTSPGTKRPPRKKILQDIRNDVSGVKRILLIEDQSSTEERKSNVKHAIHLPRTGEVKTDYDGKNNWTPVAETKRASSRRNSVKECAKNQKFSENVTFSSNNSEFVLDDLTSIHSSIDLNSYESNSTDINKNSQENHRNMKFDSITAKIASETLSNKDEVFEADGMVSIMTDQTVLKSDILIESEYNMNASVKHTKKVKDYNCYLCNNIFKDRNSLVTHVALHNIVYRCPMCSSVFKRKGDLTRHVKKKHDVPIYTTTPNDILKNIYTDHSYCIKLFNKKMLIENIPPNTDLIKQQFQCNFCDKYFAFTDKLQQHIKRYHKMTNVTLCICVTCNAVFNCNENLRDHVKFVHSVDDVCMKDASDTSQNKVKMPSKRFNWKKALVQTYKSENICDNDGE